MKKITFKLISKVVVNIITSVIMTFVYYIAFNDKSAAVIVGTMILLYLYGVDERKNIMNKIESLDSNEKRIKWTLLMNNYWLSY